MLEGRPTSKQLEGKLLVDFVSDFWEERQPPAASEIAENGSSVLSEMHFGVVMRKNNPCASLRQELWERQNEFIDLVWGKGMKKLAGFVRKLVSFSLLTPVQSRALGLYVSQ